MDINELLYREQVSLANAAGAACGTSRLAHESLARGYAGKLIAAGYPHRGYRPSALWATRSRDFHRETAARPGSDILPAMPFVVG